jgi:hypothetical protein
MLMTLKIRTLLGRSNWKIKAQNFTEKLIELQAL